MARVEVFGSLPGRFDPADALRIATTCEQAGFSGALVHYNHRVLDPWQVTTFLLARTAAFTPLVATQPYAMPPFTLAKVLASLEHLYGRPIALNLVAGSTPKELDEVGDRLDHDERVQRLAEYWDVVQLLLRGGGVTYRGAHYELDDLTVFPQELSPVPVPRAFVAGSSDQALELAIRTEAVPLTNPLPVEQYAEKIRSLPVAPHGYGIRLGIISRPSSDDAWRVANELFPPDRSARVNVLMSGRRADSSWQRDLANAAKTPEHGGVYWLGGMLGGRSHSPFLVGSSAQVAEYLHRYLDLGVRHLVLASPASEYAANAELLTDLLD